MYRYYARVTRVVDGDTLDVAIDLGFKLSMRARLRVLGVNTPELYKEERARGLAAKSAVQTLLTLPIDPPRVRITTIETDSFGRWLARVEFSPWGDGSPIWTDLADWLIERGMGVRA